METSGPAGQRRQLYESVKSSAPSPERRTANGYRNHHCNPSGPAVALHRHSRRDGERHFAPCGRSGGRGVFASWLRLDLDADSIFPANGTIANRRETVIVEKRKLVVVGNGM